MFNRHLTAALTAIGFAVICLMPSPAYSSVISLTASDTGFVTETGGTDKFDATVVADAKGNYSVGYEVACPAGGLCPGDFIPMQRKNYFTFDLSSVGAPVIGATLKLFNPIGGYEHPDEPGPPLPPNDKETYVVGATDPAKVPGVLSKISGIGSVLLPSDVTAALVSDAVMLFADLADSLGPAGVPTLGDPVPADFTIAEKVLTEADEGFPLVDVILNPAGVGYINDMLVIGLDLVLGGAVSTADPLDGPTPQSLFGFTGVSTIASAPPTLVLTLADIPEPTSLALLGLGLAGLGFARRRLH